MPARRAKITIHSVTIWHCPLNTVSYPLYINSTKILWEKTTSAFCCHASTSQTRLFAHGSISDNASGMRFRCCVVKKIICAHVSRRLPMSSQWQGKEASRSAPRRSHSATLFKCWRAKKARFHKHHLIHGPTVVLAWHHRLFIVETYPAVADRVCESVHILMRLLTWQRVSCIWAPPPKPITMQTLVRIRQDRCLLEHYTGDD